ncbi:diguanylate cyclase/phosphodiesterase [Sulfurimonas denitrificans DSM 1251]|uniref:Diguanylate cyclase/phosphodiesterase n=1 Tax=Sulfurimonas denitrificans (strain ATCC 33889 / DSM 1251) TaxID=326298 RepID=Q30SL7_SULDN|nr:GGDEF domain-containing protein [Sulfurimonas denitrificans]ABB44014.1 diguanylate cyclase/phosphodiesterase [Sulfurimonas denitrificans DSM 1251]MDD3443144.1 GGDEF domain-containing protein [Sulfurimonas denitrificans]
MTKKNDTLTNIENRFSLIEYLQSVKNVNLFLIDIDNFNNINNAYGFEVGDLALVEITRLLNLAKPNSSKLFRVNSDEFAVVSTDIMSSQKLSDIASSIISFFDQSEIYISDEIILKVSVSIGISIGSGAEILNHARIAIKELREYKRGSFKIYDSTSVFIKKQQENIYWVHKIKEAFEEERLITYYQPILNNATDKIEKYECLIRIVENGILTPPLRFMEASKLTGTLSLVTKTVIEQSYKKFSNTEYEFSINITSTDLYLNFLEEYLLKNAKKYNISPSRVALEILEDIDTLDTKEILTQLNSLRYHGFKISIDDFGSRSSNFSRLIEFSPDYLKIDGSFIKNILSDKKSLTIVEAIVLLCKKSNIKIIAEFVHNEDVQQKVKELGIEYSQGYCFGEPSEDL